MKKYFSSIRGWKAVYVASLIASLIGLSYIFIFNVHSLTLIFFLHSAVGLSIGSLIEEKFELRTGGIISSKYAAIMAFGLFGVSDFVWGGRIFDRSPGMLLLFLFFGCLGFLLLYPGGSRNL